MQKQIKYFAKNNLIIGEIKLLNKKLPVYKSATDSFGIPLYYRFNNLLAADIVSVILYISATCPTASFSCSW